MGTEDHGMHLTPGSPKEIAIVIATYNRGGPIERLLENLRHQTLPRTKWEVIVCVDGSTDDTLDVLRRWTDRGELPLKWFFQDNAGQSIARHECILWTCSEYIVVVDDDMELAPDFLAAHLQDLQVHPGRTVTIGRVVPEKHWRKKPLYEVVREFSMQTMHHRLLTGDHPSANAFVTQNVGFPRKLYLEVGGFDPRMRLDEDRELGIRLQKAGAQFRYCPEGWAIHLSDVGSCAVWLNRQYEYGRYAVFLWKKYGYNIGLHPLRNYVNGSRLNRFLVKMVVRSDPATRIVVSVLRYTGNALQQLRFSFRPAVATHQVILSLLYHQGVRHEFGSWMAFVSEEQKFRTAPGRPLNPVHKAESLLMDCNPLET